MKQPLVIIDTDALIAQTNISDTNHDKALVTSQFLLNTKAQICYPTSVITETATTFQRKFKQNHIAQQIVSIILDNPKNKILPIDQTTLKIALTIFNPQNSVKNTFFDCVVAAIATRQKADAIFSFDKFYKKLGFKLASEL